MKHAISRWMKRSPANGWSGWPQEAYQSGHYQQRLQAVQSHLAECIDLVAPGRVRLVSLCAGDGRDVIGVLQTHWRRADVSAVLVENNEESVEAGRRNAVTAGLADHLAFVAGDATDFATYEGRLPCDIALVCGVWGHVPPPERHRLVLGLTSMLKPGGLVVWTRGVGQGTWRFDEIEAHFRRPTWARHRLSVTPDRGWAVATHRYSAPQTNSPATGRIFDFQPNTG